MCGKTTSDSFSESEVVFPLGKTTSDPSAAELIGIIFGVRFGVQKGLIRYVFLSKSMVCVVYMVYMLYIYIYIYICFWSLKRIYNKFVFWKVPTFVGPRTDLGGFLIDFWSIFESMHKVRRGSFSCMRKRKDRKVPHLNTKDRGNLQHKRKSWNRSLFDDKVSSMVRSTRQTPTHAHTHAHTRSTYVART